MRFFYFNRFYYLDHFVRGYRKGTLAWNALTSHYHWHMIEIGLYQVDWKLLLAATFWVRDVKSIANTGKYLQSHWHPLIFKPHIASRKMKVVKIAKKLVYWKFCGSAQNDLFCMMNSFLMTCQNRLPQNHFIATDFSVIYSKQWKNIPWKLFRTTLLTLHRIRS